VRLVLAVVFSLALHVFLAELGGMVGKPSALPAWQPPVPEMSERIEVDVVGAPVLASTSVTQPFVHEASLHHQHARPSRQRARASPPVDEQVQDSRSVALAGSLPLAAATVGIDGADVHAGISSEISTDSTLAQESDRPGSSSGDAFGLGAFVERLRQSARRCSPKRGSGAEASLARVRFCVDALGRPETVTLLQSTGDPILDRAALECVIPGAAPLPVTDRCLVVPLRFSM
jgi:TonB family protein